MAGAGRWASAKTRGGEGAFVRMSIFMHSYALVRAIAVSRCACPARQDLAELAGWLGFILLLLLKSGKARSGEPAGKSATQQKPRPAHASRGKGKGRFSGGAIFVFQLLPDHAVKGDQHKAHELIKFCPRTSVCRCSWRRKITHISRKETFPSKTIKHDGGKTNQGDNETKLHPMLVSNPTH